MLHLNPLLREQGFLGSLFDMTIPETYLAESLPDFLKERRGAKPTSYIRTIGYTLPLRPGGKHLLGRSAVIFFDLKYWELGDTDIALSDDTEFIYTRPHDPEGHYKSCEEQGITSEDRVQLACILYDPREDSQQLIAIRKLLDIPAPDAGRVDVRNLVPSLAFQ